MISKLFNKYFLVFILSFLVLAIIQAQQTLHKKTSLDSLAVKDSLKSSVDTTIVPINDTINLSHTDISSGNLKIIISKEKEGTDYMKYIFPIITLMLGIALNKGLDYFSDRKKTKKIGKRWIAELSLLNGPISQQIESLNVFLERLNEDIYDIPKLQLYALLEGEAFKTLDKSELLRYIELFKSTTYDEAVKKSNKVVSAVNVLASHYANLKEKFNEFLKNTSSYNTSMTGNLQSLLQAFAKYGVSLEHELQGNPSNDQRYKPIADLFNTHIYPKQESGNFDVYELKDNFFIPLMKILGHFRQDERTFELAHFTTSCLNDIHGIKAEKSYMIKNAKTIKERYEKELESIPKVLSEIS